MAKTPLYERHVQEFINLFGVVTLRNNSVRAVVVNIKKASEKLEITDTAIRIRLRNIKNNGFEVEKVAKGKYAIILDKVNSQEEVQKDDKSRLHTTNESIPQKDTETNETSMKLLVSKEDTEVYHFQKSNLKLNVITLKGEVWFFAEDIAKILGYDKAGNMLRMIDDEDKEKIAVKNNGNRVVKTIINESGLYTAILNSRKPEAKKFKRWVTKEVLPSIRKHGAYITPEKLDEILLNPDTLMKLAAELKKQLEEKNKLDNKLNECKPLMELGEAIKESNNSIMIDDWVKSISRERNVIIGRNKAFKWLKDNGYLRKNRQPYQVWIDKGYFEWSPRIYYTSDGEQREGFTTLITPKGQLALTPLIIKDFKKRKL